MLSNVQYQKEFTLYNVLIDIYIYIYILAAYDMHTTFMGCMGGVTED